MGDIHWEEETEVSPSFTKKPFYLQSLEDLLPKMEEGTQIMTFVVFELRQGKWTMKKTWNKVSFPGEQSSSGTRTAPQKQYTLQSHKKEEWDV